MYLERTIAVVVPARNEERMLPRMLAGLPAWVDAVFVVDDASEDATARVARVAARQDPRVQLVSHGRRRGVGGAIASGYAAALRAGTELVVVMAGDDQMDPADLPRLLAPVVCGSADYVKGDRFGYPGGAREIPWLRRQGNRVLSALTRRALGQRGLSDTQCGFTAITRRALQRLEPGTIYPGYGYPNDVLARLRVAGARVTEVPVRPRYGLGERSKMRIPLVVLPLLYILLRALCWRLTGRLSGPLDGRLGGPREIGRAHV